MLFADRRDAGQKLAKRLVELAGEDVIVLALPRGGVPVAAEVARALGAELDVFLVRKLGVPGREELAFGAIASGGIRVLNDDVVHAHGVSEQTIDEVTMTEGIELERRERQYRGDRALTSLTKRTVVLVDDGLATGASMRAAVAAVRLANPHRVVVAVPVAPPETCAAMSGIADETVCLETPADFWSVGTFYEEFEQTSDEEVRDALLTGA